MAKAILEYDPRVDEKIAKAQPFAQPILIHLRELVHKAVPDVSEDIKWQMPTFILDGKILCGMAPFKEHCAFHFWKNRDAAHELKAMGYSSDDAMGHIGRITSLKDLPSDKQMVALIKKAVAYSRSEEASKPAPKKAAKAPSETPAALASALKKNKAAAKVYAEFSTACKREYDEWISEAKRDETRDKRVAQAVQWMADGKKRNWKYENC